MPTFCRHSRLIQNCPICSAEQQLQMRPVVSPGGQPARVARPAGPRGAGPTPARAPGARSARDRHGGGRGSQGVTVRRLSRGTEDGFRSPLVPGLRSGADAGRLADELAFAATRLMRLTEDPPGLYAEVASPAAGIEERTWLGLLIAYLGPLDGERPFAAIERARCAWASGRSPELAGVQLGPRTAHDPARGARTLDAYRAWAQRSGSQEAALTGDPSWAAERRFARAFERLGTLPGLHRAARFDLLASLGRLGVYELRAGSLGLGGGDPVTLAAKRVLGIGDTMLLERRAADLAATCGLALEALDAGLYNWERGARAALGLSPSVDPDPELVARVSAALGL